MRKNFHILLLSVVLLPAWAQAETAYVTDKLTITLRASQAENSAAVKTLEAGAALEVLERTERHARVRDKQGAEGWIELRLLGPEPAARAQLAKSQEELTKTRAQLAQAQAQLAKAQAANPAPPAAQAPPVDSPAANAGAGSGFSLAWLIVSFAMLIIGFVAGVIWVRESIRKRMGGMYLRV